MILFPLVYIDITRHSAWRLKATDDFDGTNIVIPSFCAKDQNYGDSDDHHLLHSSSTLRPHATGALLCEVPVAGLGKKIQ